MVFRSYSAPPVDKFLIGDEVELDEIKDELDYSNYFRELKDPRLDPPKYLFRGQNSHWAAEHKDFIVRAFVEKRTNAQMIDLDQPGSESRVDFPSKRRTTTPVGDKNFVLPALIQNTNILIPIHVSTPSKVSEAVDLLNTNEVICSIKKFYFDLDLVEAGPEPTFEMICVDVCKDQDGSRFIQGEIDHWTKSQREFFFAQIINSAYDLSTNLFGNYVIQKIIPYLTEDEAFKLILQFFGHICELSLHVYGCRVIQKLIDQIDNVKSLVAELENHISDLIFSPNGNHVIQKCIDKEIDRDFLLREFENDCLRLAQQRYGCRVLQRLFEVCTEAETWNIYLQIIEHIDVLINDKYGNYVIQHLIESQNKHKEMIFNYIIKNSYRLSKDKFSSNVVEKCVNNANVNQLASFLNVVSKVENQRPCLYYMCIDMYANYVVQRFFDVAPEELKAKAKAIIKPYIKEMRSIPFTKHILTKVM